MRPSSATAARSDLAVESEPAGRMRRAEGSIETIRPVGLSTAAPRPPITYATRPSAAAAACVVGAGSRPMRMTPRPGLYASTAELAAPFSSEPPAITSRPPTVVTAA